MDTKNELLVKVQNVNISEFTVYYSVLLTH